MMSSTPTRRPRGRAPRGLFPFVVVPAATATASLMRCGEGAPDGADVRGGAVHDHGVEPSSRTPRQEGEPP